MEALEARLDDDEIVDLLASWGPHVVAMDAPLGRPPGGKGFRRVERAAMRLGARLLPHGLVGVAELARRGVELAERLDAFTIVLETHPASVARVAGCSPPARLLALLGAARHPRGRHAFDAAVAAAAAALLSLGGAAILPGERWGFVLPLPGLCEKRP